MNKGRSTPGSGGSGSAPKVSELLATLPAVPELRSFIDLLVSRSVPDPERRWSGSGELGTVGDRLVEPAGLEEATSRLESEEAERLARLFRSAGRIVQAVASQKWEDVASALVEQGLADESLGRGREAEAWFLAAHRIAKERGLVSSATALRLAARAARQLGHLETAAERYEEAWREAEALGLADDATVAAIGRGNVDVDRGGWGGAKVWYERALIRIGDQGPPRRERWQVMQNLAIVARESGNLREARNALERAQKEGGDMNDPDALVEVENGWGQLLLAEGDPRGAELHFREALESAHSPTARLAVTVNLGEALLLQGRSLEAGEKAREAEAEALAGAVTHRLPEVYRLLARVAHERGEGEAFVLLERALQLIGARGLPDYEAAVTRQALGELRLAQGELWLGLTELETAAEIFERMGADHTSARLREVIRIWSDPPSSPMSEEGGSP
jgi:tetratricopeptide (TPR) repeat protein